MNCSICTGGIIPQRDPNTGKTIWDQGHNAHPVNDGRCCSACNTTVVIPARMGIIFDNMKLSSIREVRNKIKQVGRGGLTAGEKAILQVPLLK